MPMETEPKLMKRARPFRGAREDKPMIAPRRESGRTCSHEHSYELALKHSILCYQCLSGEETLRIGVKNSFFSSNFSEPPFKVLFVSFNGSRVDQVCKGNYKQELIRRSVGKKTCWQEDLLLCQSKE